MYKKLGFIFVLIIAAVLIYNLTSQILSTLRSEDRLGDALEELYSLEVKNKELKDTLEDVKSPQFIEKMAREKLGLSKEGEVVIVIPEEKIKQVLGEKKEDEQRFPNWQGWVRIFWW